MGVRLSSDAIADAKDLFLAGGRSCLTSTWPLLRKHEGLAGTGETIFNGVTGIVLNIDRGTVASETHVDNVPLELKKSFVRAVIHYNKTCISHRCGQGAGGVSI